MEYWVNSYRIYSKRCKEHAALAKKTGDKFYWTLWSIDMRLLAITKAAIHRHMGY